MAQDASTWSGSRAVLRRLRDLMAGPGTAEQRLRQIVTLIAGSMVAEVCSVYIRRAGDLLELFATEGLSQGAVHRTRLAFGEGLVGDIAAHARPLALADAQSHHLYAFRPETGEEIYSSFMGAPVLRDGRVLGVLAVQNKTPRNYTDEELETLETIAMLLAEMVAGGELVAPEELRSDNNPEVAPRRLIGASVSGGLAMGEAILYRPKIVISNVLADDPAAEQARVGQALEAVRSSLDDLLAHPDLPDAGEHRDILELFRMFAQDRGWKKRIEEAIQTGLSAEAAVQMVQDDTKARMAQASDRYLRERLLDFEDLTNRLLSELVGKPAADPGALPENAILVARNLGPSELLSYGRQRLRGIILEEGSATAHISIVARALDIPLVCQVDGVLDRVSRGDQILMDGDAGHVFLRPGDDVVESFAGAIAARDERLREYAALRDAPSVTRDGIEIDLLINAGLPNDLVRMHEVGGRGVGLYRTEISFMSYSTFPDVATQTEIYRQVFTANHTTGNDNELPITFRTLDVGGDKLLPAFAGAQEENPALGWRSVRISLDRPAMLRQQLRALIAAAAGHDLSIMFPMVADVAEFEAARSILELELHRGTARGAPAPRSVRVGVMLEVPSLAWQLPALLRVTDFLSVGSNDLAQYFFASDRNNPRMAGRYDPLSPGFLTLLADLARHADESATPIKICGEMAGRPLDAMALLGIGYRTLSMAPGSVGPVKTMTRSLTIEPLQDYMKSLIASPVSSLRPTLKAYALDHGIMI